MIWKLSPIMIEPNNGTNKIEIQFFLKKRIIIEVRFMCDDHNLQRNRILPFLLLLLFSEQNTLSAALRSKDIIVLECCIK